MPVRPPMPNIGIQAEANSIGTGNRIEPRQSDKSMALKIIIDGIEMRTVVNEKNELTASPIPVRNMWWAQTRKKESQYQQQKKPSPCNRKPVGEYCWPRSRQRSPSLPVRTRK